MLFYLSHYDTAHIPPDALAAIAMRQNWADPALGWESMEDRDAALAAILAAHPRPALRPMMTTRQAALRSGPRREARDW